MARAQWLAARQAELLAVPYFHVVFTLPAPIAALAFQNKAVVYAILFAASAEAMTTLAANPRRLGAQIGVVAVLHTWGQTLTHHPHVWRTCASTRLSRALHPSRRHRQQPHPRLRRRSCRLCLEGLSRRRRRQDPVFEARRVHPALPTPRPTRRLPSHSPLRIPRQWPPNAKARPLSLAPDRGGEPTTRGKIESPISAPSEAVDFDPPPCPECGGVMRVIADLPRGGQRRRSERPPFWCDTS